MNGIVTTLFQCSSRLRFKTMYICRMTLMLQEMCHLNFQGQRKEFQAGAGGLTKWITISS